jgi:hypothetical protein
LTQNLTLTFSKLIQWTAIMLRLEPAQMKPQQSLLTGMVHRVTVST